MEGNESHATTDSNVGQEDVQELAKSYLIYKIGKFISKARHELDFDLMLLVSIVNPCELPFPVFVEEL